MNQVIAAINQALGTNVRVKHVERRAGDVQHSCADIGLAKEVLGYAPKVSFEEGLRRAIEHYQGAASSA